MFCFFVPLFGSIKSFCLLFQCAKKGQIGTTASLIAVAKPFEVILPQKEKARAIACGYFHTLALTVSGRVYAWGCNDMMQCGFDSKGAHVEVPTIVHLFSALKAGQDKEAQLLKKFSAATQSVPTEAAGARDEDIVIGLACGHSHSLALTREGRIVAWGKNTNRQLGCGSDQEKVLPAPVSSFLGYLDRVTAVACGAEFSVAVTELGRVFGWGSNHYRVFGRADTELVSKPEEISFFRVEARALVIGISCGAQHILVLDDEYRVWTAGSNADGQLGVPQRTGGESLVHEVESLRQREVIAVFCGREHSGAALKDGTLLVWGFNAAGSLGLSHESNVFEPTPLTLSFTPQRFGGYECIHWTEDTLRKAVRKQALFLQEAWTRFDELSVALLTPPALAVPPVRPSSRSGVTPRAAPSPRPTSSSPADPPPIVPRLPPIPEEEQPPPPPQSSNSNNDLSSSGRIESVSPSLPGADEGGASATEDGKSTKKGRRAGKGTLRRSGLPPCPSCGKALKAGAIFCVGCGHKLADEGDNVPVAMPKPEDPPVLHAPSPSGGSRSVSAEDLLRK